MPSLSIILPMLNEQNGLAARLERLAPLRGQGAELIAVDGGSSDASMAAALPFVDLVLTSPRGRGKQMNRGAAEAKGDVLLFLHADTILPTDASTALDASMAEGTEIWGRFDVEIQGRHPLLPMVARLMNWRSRLAGICTGDQAMFVRRDAFEAVGGFPDIALMEDIALSKRLKALKAPVWLPQKVITSGRKWDEQGFFKTVFLMWTLRARFWLGAHPDDLARAYGYRPHD